MHKIWYSSSYIELDYKNRELWEKKMESLEHLFSSYDVHNSSELSEQIPMGWSSVCLDQTINYYIECNFLKSQTEEDKENMIE